MLGFSPVSTYPVSTIPLVSVPVVPTETDAMNAVGRLGMLTSDPRIVIWLTSDRNQLLDNDDSRLETLTAEPRNHIINKRGAH